MPILSWFPFFPLPIWLTILPLMVTKNIFLPFESVIIKYGPSFVSLILFIYVIWLKDFINDSGWFSFSNLIVVNFSVFILGFSANILLISVVIVFSAL